MRFGPIVIKDKLGREIILRNAKISDAENLLQYLKITTAETPYLIQEPDEVRVTLEQERAFIQSNIDSERSLMLVAALAGKLIGNCSVSEIGGYKRYAHRCEIAIALYEKIGFIKYGTFPDNMKYSDGTYADADWMMKKL